MTFYERYNIPKSTWIAMVRDGVIAGSIPKQEDIITCFKAKKDSGLSNAEALQRTAAELDVSYEWVRKTVNRYK